MTQTRQGTSRAKRIVLFALAVLILVPTALGFGHKFVQFLRTLVRGEGDGAAFALIPMSNYLLASLGMVCLLVWAVFRGMFRDVEGPKYTMLDQEEQIDESDKLQGGG